MGKANKDAIQRLKDFPTADTDTRDMIENAEWEDDGPGIIVSH
jgi:hypothetical protein